MRDTGIRNEIKGNRYIEERCRPSNIKMNILKMDPKDNQCNGHNGI